MSTCIELIKIYYWTRPSMFKLVQLLDIHNRKQLFHLAMYLRAAGKNIAVTLHFFS